MSEVHELGKAAAKAKTELAALSSDQKVEILLAMAESLINNQAFILQENQQDVAAARQRGMAKAMVDRLTLTEKRIAGMADGIRQIAAQPDPVGGMDQAVKRPNGLTIGKVRVPLGVIGIIYEARPNVTSDAAALCLKAGNAVILRGGKEALKSNAAVVDTMVNAANRHGLPDGSISLIRDTARETAVELMRLHEYVDVLIPRGSASLINSVIENATVPTIQTGVGNCHIFVEKTADLEMAVGIAINAKTQRPSVCNAAETLLLDSGLGEEKMKAVLTALKDAGVELHGCDRSRALMPEIIPAKEIDYTDEYLDVKMAVKVVDGYEEGVNHIRRYSTQHSECIVTSDYALSQRFMAEIDAAAVYVNASTRFTDGEIFGFGAEMGISTQKLHARGPMGLRELTSYKYVIYGSGQIRA